MEKLLQMNVKRFYKLFTVFLFTLLVFAGRSGHTAYGQTADQYTYTCTGEQTMFDKIALFVETIDIRRTVMNHITSTFFDGIPFMIVGKNTSEMQRCGAYYLVTANVGTADEATCKIDGAQDDCADLDNLQKSDTSFRDSRVAGTLLGLTNYLEGTARYEPVPVNLAYWWNDNVNRVPFAGKALAANVNYSGPFLSTILSVWKLTRNIAYGLMALVMLTIGFMIITRKKIGGQLAVTAQLAIPRVVIALILITFSYPIGAFGASMAYVLRGNAQSIVNSISWTNTPDAVIPQWEDTSAVGKVVAVLFTFITMALGVGPVVLIAALILILVSLVFLLLCYIKFFTLYLRLLFSIIAAPFTFAIGAIPGNENLTVKWFKSFVAIVIGIPTMWFIFNLSWALVWRAMLVAGQEFAFIGGGALMLFIVPFVLIYGLNFARTVPDKIEAVLIGDTKKR